MLDKGTHSWTEGLSIDDVYRLYHNDVLWFVRSILGHDGRGDAEVIASEAFVKLNAHHEVFCHAVKAWLFKTALRLALTSLKKTENFVSLDGARNSDGESMEREFADSRPFDSEQYQVEKEKKEDLMIRALVESMDELSKWELTIFKERDTLGRDYEEIASDLGCNAARVKKQYYAVNRKIKREAMKKFKKLTVAA